MDLSATAVVLAFALALSAKSASPFGGCEASPIFDRGWLYECSDWSATVEDWEPIFPDGYLDAIARAAPVQLGGNDLVRSRERRLVQGIETVIRRTQARNNSRAMLVTAITRPAGTRVVSCAAPGSADKCYSVIDFLAASPWRARPPGDASVREGKGLELGGKLLVFPASCTGAAAYGGSHVSCQPAGHATWIPLTEPGQAPLLMSNYADELVAARPTSVEVKRDRVRCEMGGVETTCERAIITGMRGRLVALWAAAEVGGGLVFGNCTALHGTSLQPPCSVLFSVSDAR